MEGSDLVSMARSMLSEAGWTMIGRHAGEHWTDGSARLCLTMDGVKLECTEEMRMVSLEDFVQKGIGYLTEVKEMKVETKDNKSGLQNDRYRMWLEANIRNIEEKLSEWDGSRHHKRQDHKRLQGYKECLQAYERIMGQNKAIIEMNRELASMEVKG